MAHGEIVEWLRGPIGKLTPQERAALLDESSGAIGVNWGLEVAFWLSLLPSA